MSPDKDGYRCNLPVADAQSATAIQSHAGRPPTVQVGSGSSWRCCHWSTGGAGARRDAGRSRRRRPGHTGRASANPVHSVHEPRKMTSRVAFTITAYSSRRAMTMSFWLMLAVCVVVMCIDYHYTRLVSRESYMRPRLLDLFCGAGGAAMGYELPPRGDRHRPSLAAPLPVRVPPGRRFDFLEEPEWPVTFDVIHASPPCQLFSAGATLNQSYRSRLSDPSTDLLTPTPELLTQRPTPWIVENVPLFTDAGRLWSPHAACRSSCGCAVIGCSRQACRSSVYSECSARRSGQAAGGLWARWRPAAQRHYRPGEPVRRP